MQNHKEQDSISVNVIRSQNEMKAVSEKSVGNAGQDPFCIYGHKRHAVGSKITDKDGSGSVCTQNGTWENSNH